MHQIRFLMSVRLSVCPQTNRQRTYPFCPFRWSLTFIVRIIIIVITSIFCWQWRRGHTSGAKYRTHFLVVPLHFLALYKYNWSFLWALSCWSVKFGQFIFGCSSAHGTPCPAICKSEGHVPPSCPMESAPLFADKSRTLQMNGYNSRSYTAV